MTNPREDAFGELLCSIHEAFSKGDTDTAWKRCKKLQHDFSDMVATHTVLGELYLEMNMLEDAEISYWNAFELEPFDTLIASALYAILALQNKKNELNTFLDSLPEHMRKQVLDINRQEKLAV